MMTPTNNARECQSISMCLHLSIQLLMAGNPLQADS